MAKKFWACEFDNCSEKFEAKDECLEHEATHAQDRDCFHVKANGERNPCKSITTIKGDVKTVVYTWMAGKRKRAERFEYDSSNVPDCFEIEQPVGLEEV